MLWLGKTCHMMVTIASILALILIGLALGPSAKVKVWAKAYH